jgi:hypothetical protein
MALCFILNLVPLSEFLWNSSAIIIQFLIFLVGLFFLWYSFIKPKINYKTQATWGVRLIYIPIIAILWLWAYWVYRPSSSESPFYKAPANIEQSCVMNGFWEGTCTFTNIWDSEWYTCWYIALYSKGEVVEKTKSATLCSGNMWSHSTKKEDFQIVGVQSSCKSPSGWKWSDVCDFAFIPNK